MTRLSGGYKGSGPTSCREAKTSGPLVRFTRQFNHPLVYVLLSAGMVTLALGELVDASVIFGVVLMNAGVGFVQESRAEAALDALRAMVQTSAKVRRDGHVRSLPAERLVPGDLVLIEAGDKIPADLRLLAIGELQVDHCPSERKSLGV